MQTIGERLEEARKKKGVSIREAAEATKIRGDYLSKFENNQFDINLTELYVRGFLRTYAQFLRLPVDRILNDYAAMGRGEARPRQPSREIYGRMDVSIVSADESGETPAPNVEEPAPAALPPRRANPIGRRPTAAARAPIDPALVFKSLKWVGIALAALVVLWALKSLFSGGPRNAAKPPPVATAPATATAPAAAVASSVEPVESTVTLRALDTVRVKVVAVDDRRVLLPDTTLLAGQSQVVPKPGRIYVTYSAGKNLVVEVGGKTYKMPTDGWDRAEIK